MLKLARCAADRSVISPHFAATSSTDGTSENVTPSFWNSAARCTLPPPTMNTDVGVGQFLGAQVGHHRRDVLGRQLLEHLRRQDVLGHPGRGDRCDGVGLDVVLRAFLGQRVDQADEPELGGAVVGLAEVAEQAAGRGGDDDAAEAVLAEVRPGRADARCSRRTGAP